MGELIKEKAEVILYMMVGLPASGKSYYSTLLAAKENCEIVSSDAIRKELFNDEEDQSDNKTVFEEVHKRIHHLLNSGKSCIYDATNLSRKRRKRFINSLPSSVKKVALFMSTEIELVFEQNSKRNRHVPEEVIMKMYKTIQLPRKDEGWDEIRYVINKQNKKTAMEYLRDCHNVEHDNPHHSTDVFLHMITASSEANNIAREKNFSDKERKLAYLATLFHDIGKPVVKSRILRNGKEDDKSHYYNHAEVGAYMLSCCGNQFSGDLTTLLNIITLVQWHMIPLENKKLFDSVFENTYGENMKKIFDVVHQADLAGH